jgi:Na+-translocating ferredoxin:NAD+ oxidoreductase RnfC subunit
MPTLRKSLGLIVLLVALSSTYSCKSKKKAMQASAAEKARIEREQAEKNRKAEELAEQQAATAERARLEAEEKLRRENEMKANSPTNKLNQDFGAITAAGNTTSANTSINEALTMFASPDTPVLIVISEEGGVKDYDRPTTIKDYLNYLKDQKKNSNTIADMKTDSSGKITELELRKK